MTFLMVVKTVLTNTMKVTMTATTMVTLVVVTATIRVHEKRHFEFFYY